MTTESLPASVGTDGQDRQAPPLRRPRSRTARYAVWFVGPFVLLFLAMYVAPIGFAIYKSLFRVQRDALGLGGTQEVFDPLANYAYAFGDSAFLTSIGRVLLLGVVQVPVMLALALGIALLIDSASARWKGFFRLSSFAPYAVPTVLSALVWSFLYASDSSPLNAALGMFGLDVNLLSENLALWAVANVVTWGWTGYNMIIIYAALQGVPGEVLEAARLDGASAFRTAWSVKIPLVRPAILLTTIFSIIGSAQLYNEPFVLKQSTGAIDASFTPIMAAQASLQSANYPYAAAQSVILAVGVAVLSVLFFRLTSRRAS
jgi:multiple sugar transport system permease protein